MGSSSQLYARLAWFLLQKMLSFKPNPLHILTAIGVAVAIAGGTLYVALIGLWLTDRLTFSGEISPILWLVTAITTSLLTIALWRHSGETKNAPTTLRLAYSIGLSLVFGWWLGVVLFVLL